MTAIDTILLVVSEHERGDTYSLESMGHAADAGATC